MEGKLGELQFTPKHERFAKNPMPGITRERIEVSGLAYDIPKSEEIRNEGREMAARQPSQRKMEECSTLYEELAKCFEKIKAGLADSRRYRIDGDFDRAEEIAQLIQFKYSRIENLRVDKKIEGIDTQPSHKLDKKV